MQIPFLKVVFLATPEKYFINRQACWITYSELLSSSHEFKNQYDAKETKGECSLSVFVRLTRAR